MGLAEAHMRHLIEVSQDLAEKVDEQADIIDALRGLLHDHKDFIRNELSGVLHLPPQARDLASTKTPLPMRAAASPPPEPAALVALRKLEDDQCEPPEMDELLEVNVSRPEKPKKSSPMRENASRLETDRQSPETPLDLGSSTDSFDEEIFGTKDNTSPVMHNMMPSASSKSGMARPRRSKREEEWPW